jgi:dTDP-4-amino-4,6-dideoxygalactose transaminase
MDIPSTRPYFSEEDIQAISHEISSILRSSRLILGPYTQKFEEQFRNYCGVKNAIAVNSCTSALEITLRYFKVEGKEVIVPTNTFIATSNAVIYSGGTPILVDIKPETLCLDPNELFNKVTENTKGVIIVHLAGLPCPDTEKIGMFCREKGLFMIEDAAHAHGALINGRKAGSLGNAGCFSFYPTKDMTTCTGGMITTDDDQLADWAVSLRHHGVSKDIGVGTDLNRIVNLGNDWLMDEISALLGLYQLKALETNITHRNYVARKYAEALVNVKGVELFEVPGNIRHSYYKYPILLSKSIDKRKFIEKMKSTLHIAIGSAYDPPCHLQPVYQQYFGFRRGMFPVAENILDRTCCLPMYAQITDEEIDYVIRSLKETLASNGVMKVEQ